MCAAVIGRQLRQQAVSGRSSGPLLPAQIPFGKNRPRAPSHSLIPPRPHSPVPPSGGGNSIGTNYPAFVDHNRVEPTVITFPIQAPSDRLNVTSKLTSGGAINAVVAQREQRALANQLRKLDLQRTSPKLRCTLHCFCVAFKALSGGLVLLTVGTIMSVFGFLMENEQKQKNKLNTQGVLEKSEELSARIRNLTYAGPVIMGLGGIVIVAALVLTFEVRDTLGIKEPAPSQQAGSIIVEKKQQKPKNLISVEKRQLEDNQPNEDVNKESANQEDGEQTKQADGNRPLNRIDKARDPINETNQLNNTGKSPMQVCTIENEMRKLSTTTKQGTRTKTPPDTLQLTTKLNQVDKANRQDYRHSRHKLSSSAHRRTNETLSSGNRREGKSNNMHGDEILETNLDQFNPTVTNVLTTEHLPDRHLSMSYSLESNTYTTTDHQQIYFGDNLHSPQDTELSESEEQSEHCSLNLNKNAVLQAKNADAHCSCSASPEQGGDLSKFEPQIDKKILKQPKQLRNSDLNYHIVEQQQKMQQQLIVQQQLLLEQQQQLTNLLQQKFHIPHPHSIETSSPHTRPTIERHTQKAISFDQATVSKGESRTFNTKGKLPSNAFIEESSLIPKSTSNSDLINQKSRSVVSIESNSCLERSSQIDQQTKGELFAAVSSTRRPFTASSKSLLDSSSVSKSNRPKLSSIQNLEFNISMSELNEMKSLSNLSINRQF